MTTTDQAWTDPTLENPHAVADKARRVRSMFAAIAPSYDLNNRVHSLGRDQSWRRAAVRVADLKPDDRVLDVACGTGDLTLAFAAALADKCKRPIDAGQVMGLDFTFEMLPLAKEKALGRKRSAVSWLNGDAMALPLPDASVDVVSIAFGIRNVAEPARAIREFHRVLRPGGRLIVLEFSTPRNRMLRGMYNFYFHQVLPRTATLIARDRSGAYRYLPRSVNTFLSREAMVDMLRGAGFADVRTQPLTCGIAVLYRGCRQ